MKRIFISYRRQDSGVFIGRIYDQLKLHFGERNVFRDVYNIPAGSDFREVLNKEVGQCDIFLAVIGRQWVDISSTQGRRRLDDPNDFVRIEVELALSNPNILVIPVLVDNAEMPEVEDLPPGLQPLCYRNAVKVRTDPDFPHDMQMLLQQIKPVKSFMSTQIGWLMLALSILLIAGLSFFPMFNGEKDIPSPTAAQTDIPPTPTPLFAPVEPVEPGQVMVLVANMEQVGSTKRDVTRFIVEDLVNHFESDLSSTNIRIREYERFITSNDEALQLAEQTQAVIVVWGQYDNDNVTVNIQLGSLQSRPAIALDRSLLEQAVNIRVKLTDERQETLAYHILSSLILIHCAENDMVKAMSLIISFDLLDAPGPEPIGNSSAAHVQKAMKAFLSDRKTALDELKQTVELAPDNPLFYMLRAILYQGMGEFALSNQDLDTALLLAPEDWILPYHLKGGISLLLSDVPNGVEFYTRVIEKTPDSWFPYNQRGYLYFLAGQYDLARSDIEKSIALKPEAEWPYMWGALIALRQGRMEDASFMMSLLLQEQPNPTFINRLMTILYGEATAKLLGESMAAMGHLTLGQYDVAIQDTDGVLAVMPAYTDMYMLRGLSYCNLDNYVDAEAAYTQGLTLDPSFALLHLLRVEVRTKQGNVAGAMEDIDALQQNNELTANLAPYLAAAQSGEFSCKQLLRSK